MYKLYFAGGWFNPLQEEEHRRIGDFLATLEKFVVFNPRLAGGDFKPDKNNAHMTQVFLNNCTQIQDADVIVAITDYKDMGTLWECGYAYANCKPIIYYCETLGDKPFNLMLAQTGKVAKNIDELKQLLLSDDVCLFYSISSFEGMIE